jgi:hypothetical protein
MNDKTVTPQRAFEMYRPLVEDNEQAIPMLLHCSDGGMAAVGIEIAPGVPMYQGLTALLQQLESKNGRPRWLLFSSEAWVQERVPMDDIPEYGELELMHRAGDPTIRSSIVIVYVDPVTEWSYRRTFDRFEDGVVWDDTPVDEVMALMGDVPLALREAVRA